VGRKEKRRPGKGEPNRSRDHVKGGPFKKGVGRGKPGGEAKTSRKELRSNEKMAENVSKKKRRKKCRKRKQCISASLNTKKKKKKDANSGNEKKGAGGRKRKKGGD